MSNNQPPPHGNGQTPQGPDNTGEEPTRHAPRPPEQQQPGQPQQYGAQQPHQPQGQPQQPYGAQQPGQPQQPHGAQQPGQSGPPPYGSQPFTGQGGEPPKKSRTGLFAIIGVVLLLIIGGAVALVLTLGGDDKDDDKSKDDESSQTTEEPSEDPTDDPSEEPSEDPTDGGSGEVSGTGYSYDVPSGWTDVTDEMSSQDPRIDSGITAGSSFQGADANILVEAGSSGGESDPEAARSTLKNNISSSVGATPTDIDNSEIGGAEAIGVRVERTNENGVDIVQIAYLAIQNGNVATVTISSLVEKEKDALAAFEEMSGSWQWE